MITKQNLYDIVVYDHQGVLGVGIVVKIEIVGEDEDVILSLDNGAVIREDVVLEYVGNAKRIEERIYDNKPSSDDLS